MHVSCLPVLYFYAITGHVIAVNIIDYNDAGYVLYNLIYIITITNDDLLVYIHTRKQATKHTTIQTTTQTPIHAFTLTDFRSGGELN